VDITQTTFTGPVAQFLLDAAHIFSLPTIRELVIDCKQVVDYDYDKHYRPLEDRGYLTLKELGALAALPELGRLGRLALWHALVLPDGFGSLLASPHLGRLRSLNLDGGEATVEVLQALVGSPIAGQLEALHLRGGTFGYMHQPRHCIDGAGVSVIATAPALVRLQALDLGGNPLGDAEADVLINSPHLPQLRHLHIGGHTISEDRLQRLRGRFPGLSGEDDRWKPWPPWATSS
jgi:hypothetical protein